ncbi:YdeI/OmpD-associated family protein [Sandarakinorhabdus oryzae]|uniref:YdeI/OmpD-associated family protein n=1 Tax=Sandarakinorhabdus oryzae TaxID=2675220 RepID=UPI0012E0E664|nr:YdeI/OmpD-associated family protein [Sandarakinorhabdus oryzae]
MPTDARVDAYIAKAQPFAQPILNHLRALVHGRFPDATETIKWSMPFFERGGRPLAMMAAFKAHAGIGIFDGSTMASGEGMGSLGKLTSLADLPSDADLLAMLEKADALISAGKGGMINTTRQRTPKAEIAMPDDVAAALAAAPAAEAGFAALPPGARREYLEWVTSAKQPATRAKRIETTVAQAAGGKKLNWRYEKC